MFATPCRSGQCGIDVRRGNADIFRGDERVLRGLVICSWAQDGLVGYEFKRGTADGTAPADYVRGPVAGLLPSS